MATTVVNMTVNGKEASAELDTRTLLVHFLRENLRLTGTHVGCDTSQCGACTVRVNDKPIKSCTIFAAQLDGAAPVPLLGPLCPVQLAVESIDVFAVRDRLRQVRHGLLWDELQCRRDLDDY